VQRVNRCQPRAQTFDRATIVGVVLSGVMGLPDSLVAVLQLSGIEPVGFILRLSESLPLIWALPLAVATVSMFALRLMYRAGLHWRLLASLTKYRLRPADHDEALERAPAYRKLITEQPALLGMDVRELAKRADLYWWEAPFLLASPTFVPRQDVELKLRDALMVGVEWPRSRGYGDKYTRQRLLRFASQGQYVTTAHEMDEISPRARAAALRRLEDELRGER
jgi:hypothetical protein